jgi:NAD(P)-dependent dehydrogenase (short-subunit alcohol dehydrogenase family)
MLERGEGRIINITSTAARTRDVSATNVPQLAYAASKAALDSFSFGLVQDLADTGVALNLLAPVVLTESVEYHLTDPRFDEVKHRMARMAPYGEAVARVADQPLDFRGRYLENHDLEALGFLST